MDSVSNYLACESFETFFIQQHGRTPLSCDSSSALKGRNTVTDYLEYMCLMLFGFARQKCIYKSVDNTFPSTIWAMTHGADVRVRTQNRREHGPALAESYDSCSNSQTTLDRAPGASRESAKVTASAGSRENPCLSEIGGVD